MHVRGNTDLVRDEEYVDGTKATIIELKRRYIYVVDSHVQLVTEQR